MLGYLELVAFEYDLKVARVDPGSTGWVVVVTSLVSR